MDEYKNFSNEDLLRLYQNSDSKAFQEFFRRTQRLVFNYLLVRLRNEGDAEEAFQDTYFRIHKYVNSYKPEKNAVYWTMGIAKNVLIDKVARRMPVEETDVDTIPGDSRIETLAELKDMLEKLSPNLSHEERTLLVQRFLYDQSYEEIATEQGIKAETIRKRLSRLLQKLKSSN